MGDADLNLLRIAYEQALSGYDVACSALNRHVIARTRASPEELQRQKDARAVLDAARRKYLAAWTRGSA